MRILKYTLVMLVLFGASAHAFYSPRQEAEDFEDILRGFWMSEEMVINGNSQLFSNFCIMVSLDFEDFKKTILDKKNLPSPEKIKCIWESNPSALREYTQKERDAIFVYLNGYKALLTQYAEELKDQIERQECNISYFNKFKSIAVGLLVKIASGSWKGAIISALCNEVANFCVEYGTDLPFLHEYKRSTDWQFLFYSRIEVAETCQIMNLREK